MKQKKCKCQSNPVSAKSSIISSTISNGNGGGTNGTTINHLDDKPSLSRQCANNWWKLKLADRKAHNELMKIQLLSPFLFCKVYQSDVWINWVKKCKLLTQNRIDDLGELSDEEIQNADLMELAITKLQEKIIEYNEIKSSTTPITQYLEEILNDIKVVEEAEALKVEFEAAINKVYKKNWFRSVRKQLIEIKEETHGVNVNDYVVFLVAWQVCFYLKSVYFDKPLDAYEKDSQLDSALEVIKKEGNEFFKNEDYSEAIKTYTTILGKKPYLYIIYGNRAACYLKLHEYRLALSDGRRAVALSPSWDKGQYRYAQALFELGQYKETYHAVTKAIKLCSSSNLISLQKMAKKRMTLGENPTIFQNPSEVISETKKDGVVENGEDADEYANMPELIYSDSDNEGSSDQSEDEMVYNESKLVSLQPKKKEAKEVTKSVPKENAKGKEKAKKKRRRKSKTLSIIEKPMKINTGELITMMREGSNFLLGADTECAIKEYKKVFCFLETDPGLISIAEIAILHYSLGWAYQESGFCHLQESMEEFMLIGKKYPKMNFPLTYYGKGLVYHKQNRFNKCISELREGLRMCDLPDSVLNCCWPGLDTLIDVSAPKKFKASIEHFINLCRHPPKPDAVCRYLQCNLETTSIYLTDPDFKGFHRFICTESCYVEFHPTCWRKYKNEKSEKDFWKKVCFTPDCFGSISSFQIFNSENKKTHEEVYKKEIESSALHESDSSNKKTKKKDKQQHDKNHSDDSSKESKRRKRLSSTSDKEYENGDCQKLKNDKQSSVREKKSQSESDIDWQDSSLDYFKDGFDINKYNKHVNNASDTAIRIYSRVERILFEKGSVDIVNSPTIRNLVNTLNENSKLLIQKIGSLRNLLIQCPKFLFDEKNRNAVYLSSQKELYEESKRKVTELKDTTVPHFDDPLFEDKIGIRTVDNPTSNIEAVPINSRAKKKSDSNDNDSSTSNLGIQDDLTSIVKKKIEEEFEAAVVESINHDLFEEIDCTRSNKRLSNKSKSKKKSKSISDIIIFNDTKKGEDVDYKIINSSDPDPSSPRKRDKKKKQKARDRFEETLPNVAPVRPSTPPGGKSRLQTYLEDKLEAEKYNKESRFCCPTFWDGCSCSGIEKFCDDTAKNSNRRVRVMKVITIEPEGKESDTDTDEDNGDHLANVLELIQNKSSGGRKRLPSCEQICVGEVGIQCDINNVKKIENDKEKLKLINDELMKRLKEIKDSNEKSSSDFERAKDKQRQVIDNQQAEIKSHKASLEKLRKELSASKKSHQDDIKRLKSEQEGAAVLQTEDLTAKSHEIGKLSKQLDNLKKEKKDLIKAINENAKKEVEQIGLMMKKNEDTEALRVENEKLRSKTDEIYHLREQDKQKHDEIVNRLSRRLSEERERTQKVQIAFLETKKDMVAISYQQQAALVQNTINQMQYWPAVPEIQNIRSIWDDFKKTFQNCYEKMQEEFKDIIQKVKDGTPLEDLPPAKYAEPPPFPKTPMPNNVPIPPSPFFGQQMQSQQSAPQPLQQPAPQPLQQPASTSLPQPASTPAQQPQHLQYQPVQRSSNPSSGQSPLTSAPPGIPIPQQRQEPIDINDVLSDSDSISSLLTKASSEEEFGFESVEDASGASNNNFMLGKETLSIGMLNRPRGATAAPAVPIVSASASSSNDSSKRSSLVMESKGLDFASTVKGLNADGYSSSPPTMGTSKGAVASAVSAIDPASINSSAFITESEDSDLGSGKNNSEQKNNRMFDRIIMRLGSIFPSFTREELRFYACEYRRMQPQGSLSGMKFDDLILNLEKMIRAMKAAAKQPTAPSKTPPQRQPEQNSKKKASKPLLPDPVEHGAAAKGKRTRANHCPPTHPHENSWSEAVSRSTKNDTFGQEEPCVICYEEMSHPNVSKLHCGHIFHRSCITCWLNEQRTCPICRVHALLPEEYPTLG